MGPVTEWVTIDAPGYPVLAYLARPARVDAPAPGVLVLQEVWGVDEHMKGVAERFAAAGFVALAPDLNSAGGERPPELSPERVEAAIAFLDTWADDYRSFVRLLVDPARRSKGLREIPASEAAQVEDTVTQLLRRAQDPGHPMVVRAAFSFLRLHAACNGQVSSVGYCQGGGLSGRLACDEPDLAAAVIYYGASPEPDEVAAIRCPIRGFYGGEDAAIVAQLPAFERALESAHIDHELRVYPGVLHAFANETRPWYDPAATRDSWARTLAFLAELAPAASTVMGPRDGADG